MFVGVIMLVGIDFGISNTDIAVFKNNKTTFHSIPSKHKIISPELIREVLAIYSLSLSEISLIGVTGGKSSDLPNDIDSIEVIKINEVDAIGLGAKKLYKIAEKIRGSKKGFSEPQAVKDPDSGQLVVSSKEIQKVCLDHCVKTLQDNPVENGFEREINVKEFLHEIRMKEGLDEESKVNEKTSFQKAYLDLSWSFTKSDVNCTFRHSRSTHILSNLVVESKR